MGVTATFQEHLRRQLRFLEASCILYDDGDYDEGIRIATILRVLFHDTNKSTSLLCHLGGQNIHLLSTCEVIPASAQFWPNLTDMTIDLAREYVGFKPKLASARSKRLIHFNTWWFHEVAYRTQPNNMEITRRDLVLSATNKDGGAHYATAIEGLGWKMTLNADTAPKDILFQHAHVAALRQMGYEVLNSPDLLALA